MFFVIFVGYYFLLRYIYVFEVFFVILLYKVGTLRGYSFFELWLKIMVGIEVVYSIKLGKF